MNDQTLEILFKRIVVQEPLQEDLDRILNFPDRDALLEFLIGKVKNFLEEDQPEGHRRKLEREVTAACFTLGALRAGEAAGHLVDLLDAVKDYIDSGVCISAMEALKAIGEPALESVYDKYLLDRRDDPYAMVWVDILSGMGVKDIGIKTALMEYFSLNPPLAIQYMIDYGDTYFLPLVERYVESLADILNENEIDPFEEGIEEQEPLVSDYLDTRDAPVLLRNPSDTPEADLAAQVEALDRRLLKHSRFGGNGK